MACVCISCSAQEKRVALTFDDLPVAGRATTQEAPLINTAILKALRAHHAPAVGFVIGERAEQLAPALRHEILHSWTEGSFELGNHTYSHLDLDEITVAQFKEELDKGQAVIAPEIPTGVSPHPLLAVSLQPLGRHEGEARSCSRSFGEKRVSSRRLHH